MINGPNDSSHFKEEGAVILFIRSEPSAGVCNRAGVAIGALDEDGAEPSVVIVVPRASVCIKFKWQIGIGEGHDRAFA